jgi:hypothetical protein
MAAQFRRSDPQAIQDVRDSQDELSKTNAQDASFYEDVLALFDEQNAARTAQADITASLGIDGLIRETIELAERPEGLDQITAANDNAPVAGGSPDPSSISDENEAARTLLALRYSGPTQNYIQDAEPSNGVTLRSFDEQVIPAPRLGSPLVKTGGLRSTTRKNLGKAAAEIQQPEGHSSTPRKMRDAGADNTPGRPGRFTTSRRAAPAQAIEETANEATLSEGKDERQRPKKPHAPETRKTDSRPDFIILSPAQDLSERTQPKSGFPMRPSLISRGKRLDDRSATPSQDPRRLRSKVKIPPASTTSVGTRALRSSTKPSTDGINLSSTSKDEVKSLDRFRGLGRFVDFSPPSNSVTEVDAPAAHILESSAKQSPAPRRSKRKDVIATTEDMTSPTPKKVKLAEQSDTDSPSNSLPIDYTPLLRPQGAITTGEEHKTNSNKTEDVWDNLRVSDPLSIGVTNPDVPATPLAKSASKRRPILRRIKRKIAMDMPEEMATPTFKRPKLIQDTVLDSSSPVHSDSHQVPYKDSENDDDSSRAPVRRKGRQILHEEHENDEDVTASIKNSPSKPKARAAIRPRKLVNAPAELPLKAPNNTRGIPNDALAIGDFFKMNTTATLGVQLPVDRARTQWEWVPYVTRKAGNVEFDWADSQHLKDVNRWRQQRIRRRFAEHGIIDDGRKRR